MRVLFIAGYTHAAYHRKLELLADSPDLDLCHITVEGYGRAAGRYPSADGQKTYRVQTFGASWLGSRSDPHRSFLWTASFGMRNFRPDLIHVESDAETLGSAQVALAKRIWAPRAVYIGYSWQNILRSRRWHVRALTQWVLRSANHMLCANQEAVAVLRRQGYAGSVTVLPLFGLDRRYFEPRPMPQLRAELGLIAPVIGYVGRLSPEKGVTILLQAVARLTHPASVLIVGSGPELADLRLLADELGLGPRCIFVEAVAYEHVADYLNALDVLVLPSHATPNWKEQFGRVLVEAMGCRVAVVGADSGAIPEVLGEAGRTFAEGDVAALTLALTKLLANPTLRNSLAERGYQRALVHYTTEHIAAQTAALWRSLGPKSL